MNVYKAIAAVQAELAKHGISKDRHNQQQGYKFRGIDDVYNALAPILAHNALCILPRCKSREVVERVNKNGTALFYVTVEAEFDFVCAEDGSKHTVGPMYGEAMDSGDKATNKAMSAAYKYAAMQAFAIPTEGDNDADATTHEVQPQPTQDEARKNAHDAALLRHAESVAYIRQSLDAGNIREACEEWAQIPQDDQRALWLAPSKGGVLTTQQRQTIKDNASKYAQQEKAA